MGEWHGRQRTWYIVCRVEEWPVLWVDWRGQCSRIMVDGRMLPERFKGGGSVKHDMSLNNNVVGVRLEGISLT